MKLVKLLEMGQFSNEHNTLQQSSLSAGQHKKGPEVIASGPLCYLFGTS